MITPNEAEAIIFRSVPTLPAEDCSLSFAAGRILRAPLQADRDLPPFDRVTMDGFALRVAALAAGQRRFQSIGLQGAGMLPLSIVKNSEAVEIATGAVLPQGADCVVPYEETQVSSGEVEVNSDFSATVGANIHRRGSDHRAGAQLVAAGTCLTGREIAVAAACGYATVRVSIQPRIAVIATGDELAEVESENIAPHHVRRSNDHALRAGLLGAGFTRVERFHFRDVREEIVRALRRLLSEFDVLLLTGGISKGKFDFLPEVLADLSVIKQFQGVAQRPGKPFWFGISPRNTPVFALPGNPVSTYTCFSRYVLPALRKMSGQDPSAPSFAVLKSQVIFKPKLTQFLPVKIEVTPAGQCLAQPMPTNTSGDFAGLIGTDGFVELPAALETFPEGTSARFWPWA